MKPTKTTTPPIKNSISRAPLRRGFFLLLLAFVIACLALSPTARGVSPAPDGGYPNGNTAEGTNALFSNTTGTENTASGVNALFSNTTGSGNTAIGISALELNTTGNDNTANGSRALFSNTTGTENTANGVNALFRNTTGEGNTATGAGALVSNTTGGGNTANGDVALFFNTTGSGNTANGTFALQSNTTGFNNTANGQGALSSNITGGFNTATGVNALFSNTSGNSNVALGASAGANLTTGSNNIDIGALGTAGESNTIRIGKPGVHKSAYVQGVYGGTVASGVGVIVNSNGHLGTVVSSERFKEQIKPMDKASEAILALQPVTFRYKHELDPDGIPQFGLVAEQVEKVNPDLVARDEQGKVFTVRYEAVNAMLLNEFLKEHHKVQELEKDLRATIAQQQKQIEALTTSLQKVRHQLEVSKAAPPLVVNNQ